MRIPLLCAITCLIGISFISPAYPIPDAVKGIPNDSISATTSVPTQKPEIKKGNYITEPRTTHDYTFFFKGELLYWQWSATSLGYVRTGVGLSNTTPSVLTAVTKTGKVFSPNFKFDTGFRAGAGVYFGENNAYDITAKYTRFHANPKGHFNRSKDLATSAVGITWSSEAQGGTNLLNFASIDTTFHLNWIDLAGGYTFDVTRNLNLRPFAGLSGMFINGNIRVMYDFTSSTVGVGREIIVHKSRYWSWGVGPTLGVDSNWSMAKNWSFFGSCSLTLPVVRQQIRAVQRTFRPASGQEFISLHGFIDATRIPFAMDFILGPQWDLWFSNNRYHFMLRASGEFISLSGAFLEFISGGNNDTGVAGEIKGLNIAATFEF